MDIADRPVRLIVEIDEFGDPPSGRVGDGDGTYVDFHGWSSMASAIERWRGGRAAGNHPVR